MWCDACDEKNHPDMYDMRISVADAGVGDDAGGVEPLVSLVGGGAAVAPPPTACSIAELAI